MSLLLDLEEVRARPRAGLREAPPMDHRGKSHGSSRQIAGS
jgi:hypothetical protein